MNNWGYVYILANNSMPGVVKIGFTKRSPFERAIELFTTGVPTPFLVVFCVACPDAESVEKSVHDSLSDCRCSERREFFRISIREATGEITNAIGASRGLNLDCPHMRFVAESLNVPFEFMHALLMRIPFEVWEQTVPDLVNELKNSPHENIRQRYDCLEQRGH